VNQLERDLTHKLGLDIKKSLYHFSEMCEICEISANDQWAHMVYTVSALLIELVQLGSHTPKDFFLSMLNRMWDSRSNRKKKGATK
jgi:hypothetical protein